MKKAISFISLLMLSLAVSAQCGGDKPTWATSSYHETLNNSYLETVIEKGKSFEQVRKNAEDEIVRRRQIAVGANDAWVKSKPIAEYWECKGSEYTGYFLYQTRNPNKQDKDVENVIVIETYPFSPRVFVPGMAQIHKGSTTKGILFIAGHVVGIGGIVAFEGLRASYQSKINTTHNVKDKQAYINNADNMQNLRNGFIAGTALLYAWNIIDGIVAKGMPHIEIQEGKRLSIAPYIAPQQGDIFSGVSLSFNF